jgi:anti-anti-sigma factor
LADTTVVRLSGSFDLVNREKLQSLLKPLASSAFAVVDLSDADYMDSGGLTELLRIRDKRKAAGLSPAHLVVPQGGSVARILDIAGFDRIFTLHESLDAAKAHAAEIPL